MGESPKRPGILFLAPFVDVPAAICPFKSIATTPIVSWFSSVTYDSCSSKLFNIVSCE